MHGITNLTVERKLTGRQLERELKAMTAAQRALMADDLASGRVVVDRWTRRQARRQTGCSFGYQNTIAHLTPHDRQRVRCGFAKLSDFHNNKPSEAAIERFLKRADFEVAYRVFTQMLEQRTRPGTAVAAE
jgi:hypothetical protein